MHAPACLDRFVALVAERQAVALLVRAEGTARDDVMELEHRAAVAETTAPVVAGKHASAELAVADGVEHVAFHFKLSPSSSW